MKNKIIKLLIVFCVGVLGGIFSNQFDLFGKPVPGQNSTSTVYVTEKKEITVQENTALQDAVERVEKVVVGVRAETTEGNILEGSGLVVSSDGLMVTLSSLVPQGSAFSFYVEGKKVDFQILKRDLSQDLALVKLGASNLSTVGFADLEKMRLGERAFLVANIFNKESTSTIESVEMIVNEGIIKKFDKDSILTNIQEKYAVSGSPLFNIAGEAMGLNIINDNGEAVAIPISFIKKFAGF